MPLRSPPTAPQPLQRVRAQRRMTQWELADAIGGHQPLVSRLETGLELPSRIHLARLCKVFNMKPSDLFSRDVLALVERRYKAAKR